jgi:hypothetical protein
MVYHGYARCLALLRTIVTSKGRIFTFVPAGRMRGLVTWSTFLTSMHLGFDQDPGSDKEALTFP